MSISAIAITYGGRRTSYTNEDLQEMLDESGTYQVADNLPKWLAVKYMATKDIPFNVAYDVALDEINTAIKSNRLVTFNVRSDRPYGYAS